MVPHLVTALTGPLQALERRMLEATPQIERWFRLEWQDHTPPFYGSVDLRNAGFKLAPVDTNLFPGGFNNLSEAMLPLAVQAAMVAIDKYCPDARNLLLIPENHTRNTFYLENVARLLAILRQTGLNVRLGSLNPEITAPTELALAADYQFDNGWMLLASWSLRDGDVVSTARPNATIVGAAKAITSDVAFGPGRSAYRLDALTHTTVVGLNFPLAQTASLQLDYEYQLSDADAGIRYDKNLFRLRLMYAY